MEEVADRANLNAAWRRVRQNGGAPGVDGITIEQFPAHLAGHTETLRAQLLDGSYVNCAGAQASPPAARQQDRNG